MNKWLIMSLVASSFLMRDHFNEQKDSVVADGQAVEAIAEMNVDVEYVLAQEEVARSTTTLIDHGEENARVLLNVNTSAANMEEQLVLAQKLHDELENVQRGLSRGIFAGPFLEQTQDSEVLKMEIGGNENTDEEAKKTLEIVKRVVKDVESK